MPARGEAGGHSGLVIYTPEEVADHAAIDRVVGEAFAVPDGSVPVEVPLVAKLRADASWLPGLALVARDGDEVVGYNLGTRGWVEATPVLAIGPLAVQPGRQGQGIGTGLVRAMIDAADGRNEPLIALLGDPGYYARHGFRLAAEFGIEPPVAEWAPHFQVLPLAAYSPEIRGGFRYAKPFMEL